jgi:ABC-type transport system involved in Fe-S cluster assembly fused permease/ATPase subunit
MKFLAETLKYLVELPFSMVSANAETFIAQKVYSHVQNQSLAFHLSRETGKVIRIVSRGSQSFAAVLRWMLISLGPLILELCLIVGIIINLYPWQFFVTMLGAIFLYLAVTFLVTEWRAQFFVNQAKYDSAYNQKATDSLLNFETVKYFNAEEHEENRF